MEGGRAGHAGPPPWRAPTAEAVPAARAAPAGIYVPRGWKLKRTRQASDVHGPSKRRKRAPAAAASAAPQPASTQPSVPCPAANPAQLAPLRCAWPHPAVLHLLAQQAWPAAGTAALVQQAAKPAASVPAWWNRMLPALSLPHPPLAPERQLLLQAASSGGSSTGGVTVEALPQPSVLVGYEDDWLEVAPQVLPMWQATPLAPFGGPKALLHCLVCPEPQLAQAQQLVKDVGALFETCCLGSHAPASGAAAVHTFSLQTPAEGAGGEAAGAEWRQLPLAARYLAGLRHTCEQLQRQLLLDPPAELEEGLGASLEDGSQPALVVYLGCPLEQPADQVAALLEAAACLAPCTLLGSDAGAAAAGLCLESPGGPQQQQQQQQQLEPCAPQQPDRPAGATPAADNSRAPGGSPPADEQEQEEGEVKGKPGVGGQQAAEQQRYHGAASVLHERQQGDFRCLPVLQLQRPEGGSPINLVLQLLTPQALADLTDAAARCTAYAVYSKTQRQVQPESPLEEMALEPGEALPAPPPVCSQPLMTLSSAAAGHSTQDVQQPAASQCQQDGSDSSLQPRTLHCCYAQPPAGSSLLPLAFTDSCGELVHAELLDRAACGLGLGTLGSSGSAAAAAGNSSSAAAVGSSSRSHGGGSSSSTSAGRACRLVLQRCGELLASLQAASGPPAVLQDIVISSVGLQPAERLAWQQLLEPAELQQAGLAEGARTTVVELRALPPARFAGPDPPSGCLLLVEQQEGSQQQQQASIAWLPPGGGSGGSLLPQEHDTVRQLEVELVADSQVQHCGGVVALKGAAQELHALAWLHAAFQGACLRTLVGGGQPAPADAHLPLHAALATQLQSLLRHACAVSAGRF